MAWKKRNFKKKKKQKSPEEITLIDVEAKALYLLSMRDHATEELRKKLKERKYPMEMINETIDRMTSYGYLNDERVSQTMTRMLIRQNWGPYQIRNKLKLKGFSEKHIDLAFDELVDEDTWFEHAQDRLSIKFKKPVEEMDKDEKQKAFRHLQYRGYGGDVIRALLFS